MRVWLLPNEESKNGSFYYGSQTEGKNIGLAQTHTAYRVENECGCLPHLPALWLKYQ